MSWIWLGRRTAGNHHCPLSNRQVWTVTKPRSIARRLPTPLRDQGWRLSLEKIEKVLDGRRCLNNSSFWRWPVWLTLGFAALFLNLNLIVIDSNKKCSLVWMEKNQIAITLSSLLWVTNCCYLHNSNSVAHNQTEAQDGVHWHLHQCGCPSVKLS